MKLPGIITPRGRGGAGGGRRHHAPYHFLQVPTPWRSPDSFSATPLGCKNPKSQTQNRFVASHGNSLKPRIQEPEEASARGQPERTRVTVTRAHRAGGE